MKNEYISSIEFEEGEWPPFVRITDCGNENTYFEYTDIQGQTKKGYCKNYPSYYFSISDELRNI